MRLKPLACVLLVLLLSGCATAKQWESENIQRADINVQCPSDKSCIYVIRPAMLGAAMHFTVYDNDQFIGETGPHSYLAWIREPGDVRLVSKAENQVKVDFTAEAGETYYLLQSVEMGLLTARNGLGLISKDKAFKYLKECHPAK